MNYKMWTKQAQAPKDSRSIRRGRKFVPENQTGIKRLYMIGELDNYVRTRYGAKEIRRRRAAGKVAKQARKANRNLRRTGGRTC